MSSLLSDHPWLGALLGMAMILWAGAGQSFYEARRKSRLADLDAGASERYFEERRSLEAYRADGPRVSVIGWIVLLLSGFLLFLD